jgi:hypothetical protein
MDRVPAEVLDLIIESVGQQGLMPWDRSSKAPYACVSGRWQAAVEALTLKNIKIEGREELLEFAKIFSDPRRRHVLSVLHYGIDIFGDISAGHEIVDNTYVRNDEAFTVGLEEFFKLMKSWEDDAVNIGMCLPAFDLSLHAYPQTDPRRQDYRQQDQELRQQRPHLYLVDTAVLPRLQCVRSLSLRCSPMHYHHLHPSAAAKIVASVQQVTGMHYDAAEYEWRMERERRDCRLCKLQVYRLDEHVCSRAQRADLNQPYQQHLTTPCCPILGS